MREKPVLEQVGRYEVRERIGEGAMADVYRAYDPGIQRVLAIKVLKAELRQNRQYAQRFLREAKAAGALSHPNIVTIYDVGEEGGYPYIAMELLEGRPLDAAVQHTGKLPADDVMAIGVQLAQALRYAHDLGVVHRDIKPSNIMLGKDGRTIKLLDFGIARVAEAQEAEHLKTQVGQVLGTPRYMSPEQALGLDIDGRSDLFSVGVVLYELITGAKAFAGASAATLALQITQQDPVVIGALAPDCPRGLQFIVGKLLAKRPERRFADGAQLAEALRREQAAHAAARTEAAGRGGRHLPLQARLTLLMATITAAVLMVSIGAVLHRQYQAMEQMALTSGSAIASFVASNAALPAVENATLPAQERDWLPVAAFVKAAAADPNVQEITVVDADGVVRAATDATAVGRTYRAPKGEAVVQRGRDLTITSRRAVGAAAGFRFVRPITYAGRAFGAVDVSISKAELDKAAALSRVSLIGLGLVILGVVIAASWSVARLLALPIRRLRAALADAAGGDLDFRISHQRKDEFGELFDSFNRFTATLQERLEAAEALAAEPPARPARRRPQPPAPTTGPFAPPAAGEDAERTRIMAPDADRTVIAARR